MECGRPVTAFSCIVAQYTLNQIVPDIQNEYLTEGLGGWAFGGPTFYGSAPGTWCAFQVSFGLILLSVLSIALSHNPTFLTGLLLNFWSYVFYLFAFCSLFLDFIFMYLLLLLFSLYYVSLTTKKQCLVLQKVCKIPMIR